MHDQFFLFCFMVTIGTEEGSKLQKMVIFLILLSVLVFSPKILGRLMSDLY